MCEMTQMLIKGKAEFSSKAKESCMMEFHLPEEYVQLEKPRVFNSHFTPRCMPKAMFDKKCKIIMLQRNPKDILTSLYHHIKNTKIMPNSFTFSEFLRYRMENGRYHHNYTFNYCKVIINRGVLIFADFVVHSNHENKNSTKYNFPIDCYLYRWKPRIQQPKDQCIL